MKDLLLVSNVQFTSEESWLHPSPLLGVQPATVRGVNKNSGQSLLEVLVTMAIAILIVGGLVAAVIVAVRNAQFAKNQVLATKYANEGMEWVRSERDADWTIFAGRADSDGNTYCLNTLSWASPGSCTSFLASIFKREAILKTIEVDKKIEVTVTVSWTDSVGPHQSKLVSYFTKQTKWK